mmetsp:Transcript_30949/g.75695  ORF Transcript_30949/g.75695 Transcript_30949/m.75695 type:complete len:839 (-) Transcript_30949:88-2604(-)|eukprot:CAMPEP_0198342054 /NCGR_PEP_ID=MMETSP1450-20131203/50854_1 /TAXON_ID=753684 ORGANISM="Madagascaria erythrocladiodes, Strain CCMP3234" /NCGR_SAMPLE_ID=MMETSP1450 /ASSEMBLY_ACC=CAM_ASM_001115 /LENGTH=838 /DNA_ID=CAMNT_0044047129 /DNA_START=51 /DNA_END=2567 /DNA_ORIENTATION=+
MDDHALLASERRRRNTCTCGAAGVVGLLLAVVAAALGTTALFFAVQHQESDIPALNATLRALLADASAVKQRVDALQQRTDGLGGDVDALSGGVRAHGALWQALVDAKFQLLTDGAACPPGFVDVDDMDGRYVVIGGGDATRFPVGTDTGVALRSATEERAAGRHGHAVQDGGHAHQYRTIDYSPPARNNKMNPYANTNRAWDWAIRTTAATQSNVTVLDYDGVEGTPAPFRVKRLCQFNHSGSVRPPLPVEPPSHAYDWLLEWRTLNVDGAVRRVITVNGRFPGPEVRVPLGANVRVRVRNHLGEPTSIHWHGMHARGSPYDDGVDGVTQCGVCNGTVYEYRFTATPHGTHWYHSHSGTQYADGLFGALIVERDGDAERWGYDDERVLMIGEWYHRESKYIMDEIREQVLWNEDFFPGNQSAIVCSATECRGRAPNCTDARLERHPNLQCDGVHNRWLRVDVERDRVYRLRVISVTSGTTFDFGVDGHPLEVIAVDGAQDVRGPLFRHRVPVFVAQRYDYLLRTTQAPNNYFIQARFRFRCYSNTAAVLHYAGAPEPALDADPRDRFGAVSGNCGDTLNEPGERDRYGNPTYTAPGVANLEDSGLTYLRPRPPPDTSRAPDVTITLAMGCCERDFNTTDPPQLLEPCKGDPVHHCWLDVLNATHTEPDIERASFVVPPVPPLFDVARHGAAADVAHSARVRYGDRVRVVLNNGDVHSSHPMHAHGHSLDILAVSPNEQWGRFDASNETHVALITNTHNVTRDTFQVWARGFVVFEFTATNPGVWFFHCHIEWHLEGGLALLFNEAPDRVPPPRGGVGSLPAKCTCAHAAATATPPAA